MAAGISQVIQTARTDLASLTGLELGSTVSACREQDGWRVQIEALAKKSIPDSQDILATYEVTMDAEANVVDFSRVGLRKRSDVMVAAAEE